MKKKNALIPQEFGNLKEAGGSAEINETHCGTTIM